MKKISTLAFMAFIVTHCIAQTPPCTPDWTNDSLFNPSASHMHCAERNLPYSQTLQSKVPPVLDIYNFGFPAHYNLTVQWLRFDSLTGLPPGITYELYPHGYIVGGEY